MTWSNRFALFGNKPLEARPSLSWRKRSALLATAWRASVTARRRLVAIAHHHIGANQPQPSLDVVAILLQPRRQPVDHAADHRAAIGLIHVLGGGHGVIRQRRRGCAADTYQRGLNQRPPWRIARRFRQHRSPDRCGIGVAAVLLGGNAKEVVALGVIGIERDGTIEFGLGFRGHHATGRAQKASPRSACRSALSPL